MKKYFFYVLLLSLIISCTEEEEFPFNRTVPIPITLDFQELNADGITLNGDLILPVDAEVLSYGFIWKGNNLTFTKELPEISEGKYSYRVSSDLQRNVDYEYRAFATTERTTYVGEALFFRAEGAHKPVITSVEPTAASRGDQITIKVDHLSNIANRNTVLINREPVEATQTSDNTITFVIPEFLTGTSIQLQVRSGELTSEINEDLRLQGPLIESVSSSNVLPMDVITVYSPFFNVEDGAKYVSLEGTYCQILEEGPGYAKIAIPEKPGTYKLFLEVNWIMGDPALAPSITVGELWVDKGRINGTAWDPVWFEFKGEIYRQDLQEIVKMNPDDLSLTLVATIMRAQYQWFFPGQDALYRIWTDDRSNYQLSEIDLLNGTETFVRNLNYNPDQPWNVKSVTIGNKGYLIGNDNSVFILDLTTTALERVADYPEVLHNTAPYNPYIFFPYIEDGDLHIFTANRTFVYNAATDTWQKKYDNNLHDKQISNLFQFDGDLYLFHAYGMYRWYSEYGRWALISPGFRTSAWHYEYDGLHLVQGFSVLKLLN